MAWGESRRVRAAASSMARGSPSRRAQISATARAFSSVMRKAGLMSWARSTKRRTASNWASCSRGARRSGCGQAQRGHLELPLAVEPAAPPGW